MATALGAFLAWLLALLQLGTWLMLIAIALHLLRSAAWAFGRPLEAAGAPPLESDALPTVTVQLPLRNERYVAERVMRAACALDWPRDRLQVQVLDDSDDDTGAIVDRLARELGAEGHDIELVRRSDRKSFKAGALANALPRARGELIAILDADSVPPADFLRRLAAPLVADPRLAFTQARWSFDNERASLLTRVQALILHGLFLVEQPRLSASGQALQFNGTAGLWRRSTLESAGGWLGTSGGASVTEDLDLSFRLKLAGLSGRILPEVAVRTELPSTMAAFRAQQQRWVRGAAEVLRGLGRRILGDRAPAGGRTAMLAHLIRHARQPVLLALALWLPAVALGWVTPRFFAPHGWAVVLGLIFIAIAGYYGAALRRLGRAGWPAIFYAPVVIALSLGLSLALTAALLRGLRSSGPGEFVRTPKRGDAVERGYRPTRDRLALVEVLVGLDYLALGALAAERGQWAVAAAFIGLFAFAWLWVGVGSQ